MENIEFALMLMAVGMTSVFVILLIVIYLGKGLIAIVNKFAPEEAPKKKVSAVAPTADAGAMDAIKAAVDILTAGKGLGLDRNVRLEIINFCAHFSFTRNKI